ncbi:hypothetical protein I3W98_29285, partial [Streptomyces cavourensis]|nr:hypothetical protein [Streptomyces cavourensis]
MIERLLPAYVSCAATREVTVTDGNLFPEEEELIARSVPKRRNDFATARACARRAMAEDLAEVFVDVRHTVIVPCG